MPAGQGRGARDAAGGTLRLYPKRIAYALYAVAAIAVGQALGLRRIDQLLLLAPLVPVEIGLRAAVAARLRRLARRFNALLTAGADERLLRVAEGDALLRFAGPRDVLLARRGQALRRLGRLEEARHAYAEALAVAPHARRPAHGATLGEVLLELGRPREAVPLLETAVRAGRGRDPRALAALGRALAAQDPPDLEAAAALIEAALERIDGSMARAALRRQLAGIYEALGRDEDATWQRGIAGEEARGLGAARDA